jgi:Gly-Xaa carboxypeptidase
VRINRKYSFDPFSLTNEFLVGFSEQYGSPVATPGISEKGSFNMQLEVRATGGHSSVPPPHTVSVGFDQGFKASTRHFG